MYTDDAEQAPVDELFRQLASPLRRQVLLTLARSPGGLDADTLAGGPEPERTRIALHHIHLPKLAEAGYIEWAPGNSTVARGPRFGAVEAALELLGEYSQSATPV
jgi:DNA-binding transcriptional ArsR family regulator